MDCKPQFDSPMSSSPELDHIRVWSREARVSQVKLMPEAEERVVGAWMLFLGACLPLRSSLVLSSLRIFFCASSSPATSEERRSTALLHGRPPVESEYSSQ